MGRMEREIASNFHFEGNFSEEGSRNRKVVHCMHERGKKDVILRGRHWRWEQGDTAGLSLRRHHDLQNFTELFVMQFYLTLLQRCE